MIPCQKYVYETHSIIIHVCKHFLIRTQQWTGEFFPDTIKRRVCLLPTMIKGRTLKLCISSILKFGWEIIGWNIYIYKCYMWLENYNFSSLFYGFWTDVSKWGHTKDFLNHGPFFCQLFLVGLQLCPSIEVNNWEILTAGTWKRPL